MTARDWRRLALLGSVAAAWAITAGLRDGTQPPPSDAPAATRGAARPTVVATTNAVSATDAIPAIDVTTAASPVRTAAAMPTAAQSAVEPVQVDLEALKLPRTGARVADAFGATSWRPPPAPPAPPIKPPPPPPPPPPAPPTAPPVPFTYLGRYEDAPGQTVFLVRGDRIYSVSPGETIDGIYRFDGITNGQVELTYLPLDMKQSISADNPS